MRAVFSTWASGLTGGASAPLAIAALINNDDIQRKLFATFAVLCMAISVFLVWLREAQRRERLEQRFAGLPKLRLSPDGFYADVRTVRSREATIQGIVIRTSDLPIFCIHCRFINDPEVSTLESIARNVTATMEFRDANNRLLFTLDGRWGDTDQPQPGQTTIDLLSVDFQIGQTREVDIAFKYPGDADSYGFNNDSYGRPDWRDPRWRLDGEDFSLVIRLRGPYIDNRWQCYFRNPGVGQPFEARGIQSV